MTDTRMLKTLLLALFASIWAGQVSAEDFPSRTVRLVVPFPPGGAIDALTRIVGQKMSATWGQPVVVDNRPGASGAIGADHVARAAPDGYTMTAGAVSTHAINVSLRKNLPYDPVKDFSAVAPMATVANVVVVNPSIPVTSVKELIALAKQRPGYLSYASAGAGTTLHISGELFKSMAQVNIVHVPYKGSGPGISDLIGGQVPIMFDSITSSAPHAKAGKVRILAVTSAKRSSVLPDVPTIAEAGLPGYEMNPWFGLFAPAGTPPAVVAKINAEVTRIVALPDVQERFSRIGAEPMTATPEAFAALVRSDVAKWREVVKKAGITVN